MKNHMKNSLLLYIFLIVVPVSLPAMAPALVAVAARTVGRNRSLLNAVKFSTDAKRAHFAQQVSNSALVITDKCLHPLKQNLSNFSNIYKSTGVVPRVAETWRTGLDESYDQALLAFKKDAKFSDAKWRDFLKCKEYLQKQNPISNPEGIGTGSRQFTCDLRLSSFVVNLAIKFVNKYLPANSALYLLQTNEDIAAAQQTVFDKNNEVLDLSKAKSSACIKTASQIENTILLRPSLCKDEKVIMACLFHELQHLINNDILIYECLMARSSNRKISEKTLRNLFHIREYCADVLPGLRDFDAIQFAKYHLRLNLLSSGIFGSVETLYHPSCKNRVLLASLLQENLELETQLNKN